MDWSDESTGFRKKGVEEGGEVVGQWCQTDTRPLDILAASDTGKRLLVVELTQGQASDVVVGQVSLHMGYVQDELAEKVQPIEGVTIVLEDDQRPQRALRKMPLLRLRGSRLRLGSHESEGVTRPTASVTAAA